MKTKLCPLLVAVLTAGLQHIFAADTDLSKLAAANNNFAFKLLKQIATEQPGKNIFISPYSAATALQMAANGAAGQTKIEMQKVLETAGISADALNAASKAAADLLNSKDTNVVLNTANALWYRQGAAIKSSFIKANQKFFSSTVKALDFSNVPKAEAEINQWASDQTHGRITGIADGMIDPAYTDLVLANAIYFKGKWLDPFDKNLTKERPFHPAIGAAKNLPMMEMTKSFNQHKGSGYQAVRLPYMGENLVMYVFLPDTNSSPAKLLDIMNGNTWPRVTMPGFKGHDVHLVLPKFKLENQYDLVAPLKSLGMKTAFNNLKSKPDPDFSNMFNDPHFISKVFQKTFVEVGEEGTEAAAVTGFMADSLGIHELPPPPIEMIVNRPFLFAIVDERSGMILFMGVVQDL